MRLILTETSLEKDLLRLMVVRVTLVSLFLGVSAILHFTERVDIPYSRISERAHYILIAFVYFLSLFWALLLNRTRNKRKLAYLQLLFDALTVTCMVYITGGVQSIFSLLYFLVIMSAGLILGKRAGYILASFCAILYGGLGDLHYYGIISPMGYFGTPLTAYPEIMFFYRIVVHIFAFYLVAFLTGLLYQRLSSSVREFKRLQSLTNNLLQNNITGIVLADQQGEFLFTNPKAKRLLFDESNRSDGSLVNHIKELLGKLKSSNSLSVNTWKLLELPNENGMSYYQVMLSQIALPDESNTFYAIYIQDITEMKVLEEELNKMESLAMVGGLAAKIAHEVKNPLAIINTVMEMLQEETGSAVGKRLFEIAFREIGRIQALIHDLLMLARPKKPFFKEIYIGEFLEELVNVLRPINTRRKRIELQTDVEKGLRIKTDPELLRQALTNVIINGLEAISTDGEVKVAVTLIEEAHQSRHLSLSVIDSGPGFSEEAIKNLFVPFFTTKEKGSGLGLVISKGILESLGASISVKNLRPKGAQVTILLPVN